MRQQHRKYVPSENPRKYYRQGIVIPPIDRFIQKIRFRFNKLSAHAATLLCLILSVTCSLEVKLDGLRNLRDCRSKKIDYGN